MDRPGRWRLALGTVLQDALTPRQADALRTAIDSLIDDFIADVAQLLADDEFSETTMADFLPRKYLPRYTPRFAKQFLVCLITVAEKLSRPEPQRLTCVAEELALAAILDQTLVVLELNSGVATEDTQAIEQLAEQFFEDRDFELLSNLALDGFEDSPLVERLAVTGLKFEEWFNPFRADDPVHPYVENNPY